MIPSALAALRLFPTYNLVTGKFLFSRLGTFKIWRSHDAQAFDVSQTNRAKNAKHPGLLRARVLRAPHFRLPAAQIAPQVCPVACEPGAIPVELPLDGAHICRLPTL